jgi:hypothetical protein
MARNCWPSLSAPRSLTAARSRRSRSFQPTWCRQTLLLSGTLDTLECWVAFLCVFLLWSCVVCHFEARMLPGLSWSVTTITASQRITTYQIIGNNNNILIVLLAVQEAYSAWWLTGFRHLALKGQTRRSSKHWLGWIIAELHVVRTSAIAGSFSTWFHWLSRPMSVFAFAEV